MQGNEIEEKNLDLGDFSELFEQLSVRTEIVDLMKKYKSETDEV